MNENDLFGHPVKPNPAGGALAREFLIPPFTVLNAREGWWQGRKQSWLALGIKSELGRGDCTPGGGGPNSARNRPASELGGYAKTYNSGAPGELSRKLRAIPGGGTGANSAYMFRQPSGRLEAGEEAQASGSGTSVFDPVLCELAYRWFCPPGGIVLDPFAGGSVRGITAAVLGLQYHGIELRPEQVDANRIQAADILTDAQPAPHWYCGDSRDMATLLPQDFAADLVFSCPPYGDLERYSDDPRDLSTLDYPDFRRAYGEVVYKAAQALKPNRFACFVVGDFRDKRGHYRNFPAHTIEAFEAAGLRFYNEAILVTAVGSLPVRTGKQFRLGRKLGRTHQQVLVFVKGDWREAGLACNGGVPLPDDDGAAA